MKTNEDTSEGEVVYYLNVNYFISFCKATKIRENIRYGSDNCERLDYKKRIDFYMLYIHKCFQIFFAE